MIGAGNGSPPPTLYIPGASAANERTLLLDWCVPTLGKAQEETQPHMQISTGQLVVRLSSSFSNCYVFRSHTYAQPGRGV
jgi:hypothetical protein